jgi:hypothetical protein
VPEKLKASFSALSLYAACPLKYRYLDVDGQAEPEVAPDWRRAPATAVPAADGAVSELAFTPSFDRELGIAVHRALARWQRGVDGGAPAGASSLLKTVRAEAVHQRLDGADLERAIERLEQPLRDYAEGPWPRRRTLFLEQPVRHVLEDGDFSIELSLRVDRVVRYQRGVAIIDFKTVPPHAFERRADTWQLLTYALAAPELLGVGSSKVALFILDLRAGRELAVDNSPAQLTAARQELFACGRGIAAGAFEVGADHPDRPCWECGFRLVCPSSLATDPPPPRR